MAKRSTKTIKNTVAPMRVTVSDDVRRQRIQQRAYERFVARGYVHGHALEDWLAAEAELA